MGTYTNINPEAWIGAFKTKYEGPVNGLWYQDVMKVYPVTNLTVNYAGLNAVGGMAAWTSTRQLNSPGDFTIPVTSAAYENSVTYPVDRFNADTIGFFMAQVEDMAIDCRFQWNSLITATLIANSNCYDAKALYHADHKNIVDYTVSDADDISDIEASKIVTEVLGTMLTAEDSAGKPINGSMRSLTIATGNANKFGAFSRALALPVLSDRTDNPVTGFQSQGFKFKVVIDPALTGDSVYAFRSDAQIGALIGQQVGGESAVEYTVLGPQSEYAALNNEVVFGVKAVRGIGCGRYQGTVRVDISDS